MICSVEMTLGPARCCEEAAVVKRECHQTGRKSQTEVLARRLLAVAPGPWEMHSTPPGVVSRREVSWARSLSHTPSLSQPQSMEPQRRRGWAPLLRAGMVTLNDALPSEVTSLHPSNPCLPSSLCRALFPYPDTSQAPGPGPSRGGGSSAPRLAAPAGPFPRVLPGPAQAAPPAVGARWQPRPGLRRALPHSRHGRCPSGLSL